MSSVNVTAYVRLRGGWLYLVAILDWFSRYVVSWALDDTLAVPFVLEAVEQALVRASPQIWHWPHHILFVFLEPLNFGNGQTATHATPAIRDGFSAAVSMVECADRLYAALSLLQDVNNLFARKRSGLHRGHPARRTLTYQPLQSSGGITGMFTGSPIEPTCNTYAREL